MRKSREAKCVGKICFLPTCAHAALVLEKERLPMTAGLIKAQNQGMRLGTWLEVVLLDGRQ